MTLRDKNALTHEEAIRDSIVSVLMSPKFCYRVDLVDTAAAAPADGAAQVAQADAPRPPRRRHPAAIGLRPGQPAELFPVVQHARRGTAGARRSRRSAEARRPDWRRRAAC